MANVYQYPSCSRIGIVEVNVAYRKEVAHYLDLIRTTYTGRTLLDSINNVHSGIILITPVRNPDDKDHTVNDAYARPANEEDAQQRGTMVSIPIDLGDIGTINLPGGKIGTGKGSSTIIEYHPATWRQRMKSTHRLDPGAGPGEMLFHEAVHALRNLSGVIDDRTVTANLRMDSSEEFIAVLLTNLYRQERGFKAIRSSHHGFQATPTPYSFQDVSRGPSGRTISATVEVNPDPNELINPEKYAEFYKVPIKQFFDSQPVFFLSMAISRVAHNPLAVAAKKMGILL